MTTRVAQDSLYKICFDVMRYFTVSIAILLILLVGCTQSPAEQADDSEASRELRIIIPSGTYALIEAGEDPDIVPDVINLKLGETDILVIQNNDSVDHYVGPLFIGAGETIRQTFFFPGIYEGGCSLQEDNSIQIIVGI